MNVKSASDQRFKSVCSRQRSGRNEHAGRSGAVARTGGAIGTWLRGDCLSVANALHTESFSAQILIVKFKKPRSDKMLNRI